MNSEQVIEILNDYKFVDDRNGYTGLLAVLMHVWANSEWLSDKDIGRLHNQIMETIDPEE